MDKFDPEIPPNPDRVRVHVADFISVGVPKPRSAEPDKPAQAPRLKASEPVRRGRESAHRLITRENAEDIVRIRLSQGCHYDDGQWVLPLLTIPEMCRSASYEWGILSRPVSRSLMQKLLTGKLYPDLVVDGVPVNWAKMPRAGRGPSRRGVRLAVDGTGREDDRRDPRTPLEARLQSIEQRLALAENRIRELEAKQ